jgi:hypothetical protein
VKFSIGLHLLERRHDTGEHRRVELEIDADTPIATPTSHHDLDAGRPARGSGR